MVRKNGVKEGAKPQVLLRRLWGRLVALVSDPASDNLDDAQLAKRPGVEEKELGELLTEEVVAEAMARRSGGVLESELAEVDRAMLARAREGHVGAARLLYARVLERQGSAVEEPLPTVEELEEELRKMKGLKEAGE